MGWFQSENFQWGFFLIRISVRVSCRIALIFSSLKKKAGSMYLQYYINENGNKVYTTKVCDDDQCFRSLLEHVATCRFFGFWCTHWTFHLLLWMQKESPLGEATQSAHPGKDVSVFFFFRPGFALWCVVSCLSRFLHWLLCCDLWGYHTLLFSRSCIMILGLTCLYRMYLGSSLFVVGVMVRDGIKSSPKFLSGHFHRIFECF